MKVAYKKIYSTVTFTLCLGLASSNVIAQPQQLSRDDEEFINQIDKKIGLPTKHYLVASRDEVVHEYKINKDFSFSFSGYTKYTINNIINKAEYDKLTAEDGDKNAYFSKKPDIDFDVFIDLFSDQPKKYLSIIKADHTQPAKTINFLLDKSYKDVAKIARNQKGKIFTYQEQGKLYELKYNVTFSNAYEEANISDQLIISSHSNFKNPDKEPLFSMHVAELPNQHNRFIAKNNKIIIHTPYQLNHDVMGFQKNINYNENEKIYTYTFTRSYDQSQANQPMWLYVSTSFDWQAYAKHSYQAHLAMSKVTPNIRKLVNQIVKNTDSEKEKATKIFKWVHQNMTFENFDSIIWSSPTRGYGLKPVDEILKNKRGVCRDYIILLMSLLKAANITAVPVEVDNGMINIADTEVVGGFFGHIIVYLPSLNVYLDATIPNAEFGKLSVILKNKLSLRLDNATTKRLTEITDIPLSNKKIKY